MVSRWMSVALILYSFSLYGWWNVCCDNRPTEARRWSAWSEWSVCNHHCGASGFRFRSRACSLRRGNRTTIRRLCPGNRFEREACVSRLCLLQPDQLSTALDTPQQQRGLLNQSTEVTSQITTTSTPLTSETVFNTTASNSSMTTQAPNECPYFCDSRVTTCGRPTYYSPKKIVGGTTSQKNAWPWQVGVWSNQRLLCSATVICSGWVMTSAHCFLNLTTLEMRYDGIHLRFGSHTRERVENGAYVRSLNKSQVFLHPMYNIWLKKYDIALVRLDPPLRYSRTVAPACLPDMMKLSVQPGELCYVAGWGTTNGKMHKMRKSLTCELTRNCIQVLDRQIRI
ncbi:suppressor of tumorigenicity 14 protein homolog [Ciona intestinalis]